MVDGVRFNYQAPEIQVQDRRQVSQRDPGANVAQQLRPISGDGRTDMLTNLAGEIAGLGRNFANQAFNIQTEKAYAEGAAEVGIADSEESLNSDPFTRDWKVAGFRDTTAKYALADATAQFELDLVRGPKLQEQDPEALKAYLTQRRDRLTPLFAGMSGDQRTAAMAKMALLDRTNIAQHNTAYRAFVHGQTSMARATVRNTQLASLSIQKANAVMRKPLAEVAFNRQMDDMVAETQMEVLENDKWTLAEKQSLISYDLESALATDNVDLYKRYDEAGFTAMLAPNDAVKLSNKYREANSRNLGIRAMQYNQTYAKMKADMDAGLYTGTVAEAVELLDSGLANNVENSSTYQTKYNGIMDWANKMGTNGRLVEATLTGNDDAITRMGKTESDGIKAVALDLARSNKTPLDKLETWAHVSARYPSASKELGKLIAQPMSILFSPEQGVLPEHTAMFNASLELVRKAEANGNNLLRLGILSSMSDNDRLRFDRMYELHTQGNTLQGSINEVQRREVLEQSISPTRRMANTQKLNTELNDLFNGVSGVGFWDRLGLGIGAWFSKNLANELKISPENNMVERDANGMPTTSADGVFSTSETVRYYESIVRENLLEESEHQRLVGYDTGAKSIYKRTVAAVAGRTIKTEAGPLILSRGFDSRAVFGVTEGNIEAVGPAIDRILAKTESAKKAGVRYRVSFAQGIVYARAFDANNAVMDSFSITPDMVRAELGLKAKADIKANDETYGKGKTITSTDVTGERLKLTYNGVNSAAVEEDWMLEFRDNLVKHENFKAKAYEDKSGKMVDGKPVMTVGVGVSSHNKEHYPKPDANGNYSPEALQASFLSASNAAATAGRKTMEDVNLRSKSWFNLFAELSYQSGPNFLNQPNAQGRAYRTFVGYAQAGNIEKTLIEFKKTPAYFYSRDKKHPEKETERQKFYLNTIRNAMKGE